MNKISLIIQREYTTRVKKKSFIIITSTLKPIGWRDLYKISWTLHESNGANSIYRPRISKWLRYAKKLQNLGASGWKKMASDQHKAANIAVPALKQHRAFSVALVRSRGAAVGLHVSLSLPILSVMQSACRRNPFH